jgi:hypothetical protein
VGEPVRVRRDQEKDGGERGRALERRTAPQPEPEGDDGPGDGDPRRPRRSAVLERVAEVPGVRELEDDSGRERSDSPQSR